MNQLDKFTNNISIAYQDHLGSSVATYTAAAWSSFKLKDTIIARLQQHIGIKCMLALLIMMLSYVCLLVNHYNYHYHPLFFQGSIILISKIIVFMFLGGSVLELFCPRLGAAVKTLSIIYFLICLMEFADSAIQITPFYLYDHLLCSIDQTLGFNTLSLLQWMHVHPQINTLTWYVYNSLIPLLILCPIVMTLLQENKAVNVFLTSILVSMLIGYTLYYFFPTAGAPTGALQSPYFTAAQQTVLTQFNQIHHFQPVTHSYHGIIGFPSFHVIWAILLAYLFRTRKYLFCLVSIYSFLIMLSAFATGWHYFTDVIGGVLVGMLTLYIAEKLCQDKSAI